MGERKKFRIQRALGVELPGLGKAGALARRNYPPGQHGRLRKQKISEFGTQLREKQKLLFHYGIREQQLRRFVRDAQRINRSNWIEALLGLLERRVDNVVFRLGFARSMSQARQLVSHGHIVVNGRLETISSRVLRIGDFVQLTRYAADMPSILHARQSPRLPLPGFLQLATPDSPDRGVLISLPGSAHVPFPLEQRQVAEYYAKRGF